MRTRILIYTLLAVCVLQTCAICKQAQWLHQQRQLIRLLWDARRPAYHRPYANPVYRS